MNKTLKIIVALMAVKTLSATQYDEAIIQRGMQELGITTMDDAMIQYLKTTPLKEMADRISSNRDYFDKDHLKTLLGLSEDALNTEFYGFLRTIANFVNVPAVNLPATVRAQDQAVLTKFAVIQPVLVANIIMGYVSNFTNDTTRSIPTQIVSVVQASPAAAANVLVGSTGIASLSASTATTAVLATLASVISAANLVNVHSAIASTPGVDLTTINAQSTCVQSFYIAANRPS